PPGQRPRAPRTREESGALQGLPRGHETSGSDRTRWSPWSHSRGHRARGGWLDSALARRLRPARVDSPGRPAAHWCRTELESFVLVLQIPVVVLLVGATDQADQRSHLGRELGSAFGLLELANGSQGILEQARKRLPVPLCPVLSILDQRLID